MKKCTQCGQMLEDGQLFCTQCGTPVPDKKRCTACGAELDEELNFCPQCGQKIVKLCYCTQCGTKLGEGMMYCPACGSKAGDTAPVSIRQPAAASAEMTKHVRAADLCKDAVSELTQGVSRKMETLRQHKNQAARSAEPASRKKLPVPAIIAAVVAVIAILAVVLHGCGGGDNSGGRGSSKFCTATDQVRVDGIYVNQSYESDDHLIPLYLYLSVTATNEDLKLYSQNVTLTFDDESSYDSQVLFNSMNKYQEKYHYSEYVENVYGGETGNVCITFLVPASRLENAESFTIACSHIPTVDQLRIPTSDILYLDSDEEICSQADPEGYQHDQTLRQSADADRVKAVQDNLSGRYWLVSTFKDTSTCRITFKSPNLFDMEFLGRTNSGIYEVREGYIYCSYDEGITYNLQIPYTIDENGKVTLTFTNVL